MSINLNEHSKRSIGVETRGKTRENRLRRVDNLIIMYCSYLLMSSEDMFVDVGFGSRPVTTLESCERFRRLNKSLKVVGIEIDKKRARDAEIFNDDQTDFRCGGFNIPLKKSSETGRRETINLIRVFNVFRQYENESDWRDGIFLLGKYLKPNGVLIEGTSNPSGSFWVANLFRKKADRILNIEALIFSTNFSHEFRIELFQEVLPKNLIHRMTGPNEAIFRFFQHWKISFEQFTESSQNLFRSGIRQKFSSAAHFLAENFHYDIVLEKKYLRRGFLIWKIPNDAMSIDNPNFFYPKQ